MFTEVVKYTLFTSYYTLIEGHTEFPIIQLLQNLRSIDSLLGLHSVSCIRLTVF